MGREVLFLGGRVAPVHRARALKLESLTESPGDTTSQLMQGTTLWHLTFHICKMGGYEEEMS